MSGSPSGRLGRRNREMRPPNLQIQNRYGQPQNHGPIPPATGNAGTTPPVQICWHSIQLSRSRPDQGATQSFAQGKREGQAAVTLARGLSSYWALITANYIEPRRILFVACIPAYRNTLRVVYSYIWQFRGFVCPGIGKYLLDDHLDQG